MANRTVDTDTPEFRERQAREVHANYAAFKKLLPGVLEEHRGKYAVMRDKKIVGFFRTMDEAGPFARAKFADGHYSVQIVTDEPIDFGIFSRAPVKR